MNAFWTIVRHELRVLFRERIAWAVLAVLALATVYGLVNGFAEVEAQRALVQEALTEETRTFRAFASEAIPTEDLEVGSSGFNPATNAGILALFYPRIAALPPAPLAALSIGQSKVYPAYFRVTAERRDSWLDEPDLANPTHLLTGAFDVAFVIVVLLPLLLLFVSYNLVSAEREEGTLRLLLAQPLQPRTLVLAKLAARSLLPGVLIGVVTGGLLLAGELPNGSAWGRLVLWAVTVAAYSAFWLALASIVNTWRRSTLTNALVLLGLWMMLVLVVPALLHLVASEMAPVPSRTELILDTRSISEQSRQPVALLEAYYEAHPERRPQHPDFDLETYDFPLYWAAIQREVERRMSPVVERYDAAIERQRRYAALLQLLSPAVLTQNILNDLSGSGLARQQRFMIQVNDFYDTHWAFYEPLIFSKKQLSSADYLQMPRFSFKEEPMHALARRIGVGIAVLLALAAGLLTLAVPGYRDLNHS